MNKALIFALLAVAISLITVFIAVNAARAKAGQTSRDGGYAGTGLDGSGSDCGSDGGGGGCD
jgi:hypothetical protein